MNFAETVQSEYAALLTSHKSAFAGGLPSIRDVCLLIDDVTVFWLEHEDEVEAELERLSQRSHGVLLAGGLYLNFPGNGHFPYRLFGDFRLISDPFIKLHPLARRPKLNESSDFRKTAGNAFRDTLIAASRFSSHFWIVPAWRISIEDETRHDYLQRFFWRFLSSIFDDDIADATNFAARHNTFEEIESAIVDEVRNRIVFRDMADAGLPLRERISVFQAEYGPTSPVLTGRSEPQTFLNLLFSMVAQPYDALLTCLALQVMPYFRNDIQVNYLSLFMHSFTEEPHVNASIHEALLGYAVSRVCNSREFADIDFDRWAQKADSGMGSSEISAALAKGGVDLIEGPVAGVAKLVESHIDQMIDVAFGDIGNKSFSRHR